jgi:hypothetical protein
VLKGLAEMWNRKWNGTFAAFSNPYQNTKCSSNALHDGNQEPCARNVQQIPLAADLCHLHLIWEFVQLAFDLGICVIRIELGICVICT